MESFGPLFALILIWVLVGLPLSKLSQAAKKNASAKGRPTPNKTPPPPEVIQVSRTAEGESPRHEPLRPTVTVTGHDDSVYQGSLNAETGEGFDPCHDEQMEPLTELRAEAPSPGEAEPAPGLRLSFGGDEVIRGLVMSEILKRRA